MDSCSSHHATGPITVCSRGHEYLHANGVHISGTYYRRARLLEGKPTSRFFMNGRPVVIGDGEPGSLPECDKTEFIRFLR